MRSSSYAYEQITHGVKREAEKTTRFSIHHNSIPQNTESYQFDRNDSSPTPKRAVKICPTFCGLLPTSTLSFSLFSFLSLSKQRSLFAPFSSSPSLKMHYTFSSKKAMNLVIMQQKYTGLLPLFLSGSMPSQSEQKQTIL